MDPGVAGAYMRYLMESGKDRYLPGGAGMPAEGAIASNYLGPSPMQGGIPRALSSGDLMAVQDFVKQRMAQANAVLRQGNSEAYAGAVEQLRHELEQAGFDTNIVANLMSSATGGTFNYDPTAVTGADHMLGAQAAPPAWMGPQAPMAPGRADLGDAPMPQGIPSSALSQAAGGLGSGAGALMALLASLGQGVSAAAPHQGMGAGAYGSPMRGEPSVLSSLAGLLGGAGSDYRGNTWAGGMRSAGSPVPDTSFLNAPVPGLSWFARPNQ